MARKSRIDYNYVIQDISMLLVSIAFGIIITPWLKEILSGGDLKGEDYYYFWVWMAVLIILVWINLAIKVGALRFGSAGRTRRRRKRA